LAILNIFKGYIGNINVIANLSPTYTNLPFSAHNCVHCILHRPYDLRYFA